MSVGERAVVTPELLHVLRERYGLRWTGEVVDLGGSVNLNIHLPAERGGFVARPYTPSTTSARLSSSQSVRSRLAQSGLSSSATTLTHDGATWVNFDGRVLEVERYISGERMD